MPAEKRDSQQKRRYGDGRIGKHNHRLPVVPVDPDTCKQGDQYLRQEPAQGGNRKHLSGGGCECDIPDNRVLHQRGAKQRDRLRG